jgi:hypothetical protein
MPPSSVPYPCKNPAEVTVSKKPQQEQSIEDLSLTDGHKASKSTKSGVVRTQEASKLAHGQSILEHLVSQFGPRFPKEN